MAGHETLLFFYVSLVCVHVLQFVLYKVIAASV